MGNQFIEKAKIFWKYYRKAKTIYKIHSPFVYAFIDEVIHNHHQYYAFDIIESYRQELLKSGESVSFREMGAGSRVFKNDSFERKISEIAKSSSAPPQQARYLFHIVNKFSRKNVLELGTSLGFSTLYMMSANSAIHMTTMEGNAGVLKKANSAFKKFGFPNINSVLGNFDDTLQKTLEENGPFDLVYLDGNHSYEATVNYWSQILPYCTQDAIIVFDDIHWSAGMYEAWEKITTYDAVKTSIEIYDLGFIFLNENLPENTFTYIDFWWKPWQIGLFS